MAVQPSSQPHLSALARTGFTELTERIPSINVAIQEGDRTLFDNLNDSLKNYVLRQWARSTGLDTGASEPEMAELTSIICSHLNKYDGNENVNRMNASEAAMGACKAIEKEITEFLGSKRVRQVMTR